MQFTIQSFQLHPVVMRHTLAELCMNFLKQQQGYVIDSTSHNWGRVITSEDQFETRVHVQDNRPKI